MKKYVDRYASWVQKTKKNLTCAKGREGNELLSRFQTLELREDVLGCLNHSKILHKHIKEYGEEKQNIRWLEKLVFECERWEQLFDCTCRVSQLDKETIIQALIESEIDVEFAVNLA